MTRVTRIDIPRQRLRNQLLVGGSPRLPVDVVRRLGAVQAQDYLGALWAVGQRCGNVGRQAVEDALSRREIVRTWPMRGTLHFVAGEDVRWMLALLAQRVARRSAAAQARAWGLTEAVLRRCRRTLIEVLEGGRALTRSEVYQRLEEQGVSVAGQRGLHILWRLAHDGVICFGARAGKQQTFVLLEEWIPGSRTVDRETSLAELAQRYFSGHGPASLRDFVWWSGLTVREAREAVHLVRQRLTRFEVAGETYWLGPGEGLRGRSPGSHLLPPFDEYLVGYRDRSAVLDGRQSDRLKALMSPALASNGRIVGTWSRRLTDREVRVRLSPFGRLRRDERAGLLAAVERYARFLGVPALME